MRGRHGGLGRDGGAAQRRQVPSIGVMGGLEEVEGGRYDVLLNNVRIVDSVPDPRLRGRKAQNTIIEELNFLAHLVSSFGAADGSK